MLDGFNWDLFARFAKEYLRPVWAYPAQAREVPFPWERWPEFLEAVRRRCPAANFIAIYELKNRLKDRMKPSSSFIFQPSSFSASSPYALSLA